MSTAWRPTAALQVLLARAAMLAAVRAHFAATGAVEVETPLLSAAAVSDVHLESVPAAVAGVGPMFLHTSPEYPMKRLLAAGIGDCYQICRVFRDGERGRQHNPEFTMIEWYRVGAGLETLMDDVAALVALAVQPHRTLAAPRRVSYREAVRAVTGIDPPAAPAAHIESALRRAGVALPEAGTAGRDELLDLLVSAVVGPALGRDAPLFVRDFPASQAALARLCPGDPSVAERFELYIDGMELANGFHELADAAEQRRRFEADLQQRRRRNLPERPLDERFLAALEHGLPDCSGVALGFDRLVMTALELTGIEQAIPFPVETA